VKPVRGPLEDTINFGREVRRGVESRADREPCISFPDDMQNIKLIPEDPAAVATGPMALVTIRSDPIAWTGLPFGQYDAMIAIERRAGAEVASSEIRIAPRKDQYR
jgi:hypothetical protein